MDPLPIVLRAWTSSPREPVRWAEEPEPADYVLVFDTETTTDAAQSLLYGAYRFCRVLPDRQMLTLVEGLIYADDLVTRDPRGLKALTDYVAVNAPDVAPGEIRAQPRLTLVSRAEFVERSLWNACYKGRATLVGFNIAFDLSRIALGAGEARGPRPRKLTAEQRAKPRTPRASAQAGGISLQLWSGVAERSRPRIVVKSLDSKRALKTFTRPDKVDREDQLGLGPVTANAIDAPQAEEGSDPDSKQFAFKGRIVDLRTLGFALTNQSFSLKTAGDTYQIAHPKIDGPPHGVITADHIDYCRRDVLATAELFTAMMRDLDAHPIVLQPGKAYSPASVAKAYLRAMGVVPRLDLQPDFPPTILGYAMSAFYGGRAECHWRRESVPVRLLDFTSMYPTVVALMEMWPLITAQHVKTINAKSGVQAMLNVIARTRDVPKEMWPLLVGLAQIHSDGDVLPVRAEYGEGNSHTIGVNHLHTDEPLWYTLTELAASAVLTGRAPRLTKALRLAGKGQQRGLVPVKLGGKILIDPRTTDPFRVAVEERQRIKNARTVDHDDQCMCGECALMAFLKVFANSGSYGIHAEMIRNPLPGKNRETVTVYANRPDPWQVSVTAIETPGAYCFPPVAACITSAARLMLALAEHRVTAAGGTWVFCDTDSIAIIATEAGGRVAAENGDQQLPDGTPAVMALSYAHVDDLMGSFSALNPYDPTAVPGSILRLDKTGMCHAISAKRYCIWEPTDDPDHPVRIVKASEHGLGHLLNPYAPPAGDDEPGSDWIHELWEWIIGTELGLDPDTPGYFDQAALSRYTITSPGLWAPFDDWNEGLDWQQQIKPFNFLLLAHVDRLSKPVDLDGPLTLIAPYSSNPDEMMGLRWRNRYDPHGPTYSISTDQTVEAQHIVRVQTYADIVGNYRRHSEAKFVDGQARPCGPNTHGSLSRRHVTSAAVRYIGKEADLIDEVSSGLINVVHSPVTCYTSEGAAFRSLFLPVLASMSNAKICSLAGEVDPSRGLSTAGFVRKLQRMKRGSIPHGLDRALLEGVALLQAVEDMREGGSSQPWADVALPALRQHGGAVLRAWQVQRGCSGKDSRDGRSPPRP